MFKLDWEAVRAYLSPVVLTVIALFALWKDAKDYRDLVENDSSDRPKKLARVYLVPALVVLTLLILVMGMFDIHASRHKALQDKADAQSDKAKGEKEVSDLKAAVKSGNDLLGQQRRDFLQQFAQMSDKVSKLETEIKTSDLKEESSQLRGELESTRKSLEVPKATLSFSFWDDAGQVSNLTTANIENGVVKLKFNILNASGTDAMEGFIILDACQDCKIMEVSPGFVKLAGQADNERNFDFQHIFANSRSPQMYVSIAPPPEANSFQIGIRYRCRTCALVQEGQALPPNDLGTVLLGPHWKSGKLNLNKVTPPKKAQ